MYTVKQLCNLHGISEQTFYALKRKYKDFSDLIDSTRIKKSNGFRYTDAVSKWLREHYEQFPSETVSEASTRAEEAEALSALSAQIALLEADKAQLTAQVSSLEADKAQLTAQINQLLLLLQQEKAEKQALLPKPHISWLSKLFRQQ